MSKISSTTNKNAYTLNLSYIIIHSPNFAYHLCWLAEQFCRQLYVDAFVFCVGVFVLADVDQSEQRTGTCDLE